MTAIAIELTALADSDGLISPERVVAWAQSHRRSALHEAIPWDDKAAAHAHRLSVVRRLIAVHIIDVSGHRQTVSLIVDRHKDAGYRSLPQVLSNSQFRALALQQALDELVRWSERHRHFEELEALHQSIALLVRRYHRAQDEAA